MAENQTFLSDRQVAERFGVHRLTVWRWHRDDPTFPRAVKLSARCTRFSAAEVDAWVETRAAA